MSKWKAVLLAGVLLSSIMVYLQFDTIDSSSTEDREFVTLDIEGDFPPFLYLGEERSFKLVAMSSEKGLKITSHISVVIKRKDSDRVYDGIFIVNHDFASGRSMQQTVHWRAPIVEGEFVIIFRCENHCSPSKREFSFQVLSSGEDRLHVDVNERNIRCKVNSPLQDKCEIPLNVIVTNLYKDRIKSLKIFLHDRDGVIVGEEGGYILPGYSTREFEMTMTLEPGTVFSLFVTVTGEVSKRTIMLRTETDTTVEVTSFVDFMPNLKIMVLWCLAIPMIANGLKKVPNHENKSDRDRKEGRRCIIPF